MAPHFNPRLGLPDSVYVVTAIKPSLSHQLTLVVKFKVASNVLYSLVKLYISAGMIDRAEACVNELVCFKCEAQEVGGNCTPQCCGGNSSSKQQQYGPTVDVLNQMLAAFIEGKEYVKAHELSEKFLRSYGIQGDPGYMESINNGLSVPETEVVQASATTPEEDASFLGLS